MPSPGGVAALAHNDRPQKAGISCIKCNERRPVSAQEGRDHAITPLLSWELFCFSDAEYWRSTNILRLRYSCW